MLPRILRRVIREHRKWRGWGWNVPHRKSYIIDRDALLAIVEPAELREEQRDSLPRQLVLLPEPTPQHLAETSAGDVLIEYWRLLFHARVHLALETRMTADCWPPAEVRRRIRQIGPTTFDEIRTVLQQENLVLPPGDDATIYAEFAAVYLELRHFAPSFLPRYFPAIEHPEAIDEVLAQDVDGEGVLHAARPAGAPEPHDVFEPEELDEWAAPEETPADDGPVMETASRPSERRYRRLTRRAQKAAAVGNLVRSAMFRVRAQQFAPRKLEAMLALRSDLDQLAGRLCAALEIGDEERGAWRDALAALVRRAPSGIWTAEARLLYDLQKVCVDFEREIHTVDLVEWMLSLGKRPIRRPLPYQRDVLMSKHLRSAARRLPAARLSDRQRQQLFSLLRDGMERTETRIRERFRPQITAVLDDVGLAPRNVPERVARKKLVEELLDRVVEHGYLRMGDVRDALSRNNLKLPDLPAGLLRRDELLEADRRLAVSLDGVYHRGEIYLRAMQHLVSLLFGTRAGRFITRYLALPFGGGFLAVAGVDHLVGMVGGWLGNAPPQHEDERSILFDPTVRTATFLLGLLLVGLINSAPLRNAVWQGTRRTFRALRSVLLELPRWILRRRWIQRILHSRPVVMAWRFGLKPAVWTMLLWPFLAAPSKRWDVFGLRALLMFIGVNLLLNSRAGRQLEELTIDWIQQAWHRFGLRLLASALSLIMEISKEILEAIERFMYAVDEWLRFKSGESQMTFWLKAVLGLAWFAVTYVVRFCINLLIEPQFNPIKHFPVVTVSHKLLLPLIPHLAMVLSYTMERGLAWTVAGTVIFSIPGIFGFLVWELKENWRLYAANRSPDLGPIGIGAHGETMPRLLKRGFHSGTLPKRFAKLRRAERKARLKGNWKAVRKHLHALHRVELAVRRFIERELVGLLEECSAWQGRRMRVDDIHVGPNLVRATLNCAGEPLVICMEVRSGWLLTGLVHADWAGNLPSEAHTALANAILKLYKTADADLVHQQLEAVLPSQSPYDVCEQGLVVWHDGCLDREALYDLHQEGVLLQPTLTTEHPMASPMPLPRSEVLFREVAIPWNDWVWVWEEPWGTSRGGESIVPVRVLPESAVVIEALDG